MKRALWLLGLFAGGCDSPGDGSAATSEGSADTVAAEVADTADRETTPTEGDNVSSGDEPTEVPESLVCERWRADRAELVEGRWTGSASSCDSGDYLEPGPTNTVRQVNLYRWLAGLPPVELSAGKNAAAQTCALLMHANRDIVHQVPSSWSCWSQAGSSAARLSNLATTPAVFAVDLYMTDQNVIELGHRRWILSNSLGPIGVGSTTDYSCLHVIGGDGRAGARWTAWPPPGEIPIQALHIASWMDVDRAGWSIQSDYVDLRAGAVTVTRDGGSALEIDVWSLAEGYGSTFGLGIRPRGWRTAAGETYRVAIGGLVEEIAWEFTVVDCR